MARQQEVLEVAKQIIEAEAKLAKLRDRFSLLVPDDAPAQKSTAIGRVLAAPSKGVSVPMRVVEFMSTHPGRVYRVQEIHEALPDINVILLRNTVFRMGVGPKARLAKHGRGEYSLKGSA